MESTKKIFMIISDYKVIGLSSTKDENYISIEITEEQRQTMFNNNANNHIEYYYVENELIECDTRNKPLGCKIEFNPVTKTFEEKANLEEQIEYYKNLIIEKTRENELLKMSGFTGTQEEINLQTEIKNLRQIYLNKSHELALQIENKLK